jgi:glycosyltransferase involved in cell wall biosynthesis
MKIAWLHSFPPDRQHAGVFMHELVEPVEALGNEVSLIYTGDMRSLRAFPATVRRAQRQSADADLIHAQYGSGCGLVGSFLKAPRVLTLRGSDWYGVFGSNGHRQLQGMTAPLISRAILRRYDHVCVASERMRREVAQYVPATRISTIPSGIDLRRFVPRNRADARRALGAPDDDRPWVLFSTITEDNPVKRPALAHTVMSIVRAARPEVQLKTMSGVPRERVPMFVSSCDVVLLTSKHEGWPNVVKEGLACNIPFVSTDVSDLRSIAEREASCVVTNADADALAAGVLSALDAPKNELRQHVEHMSMGETSRTLARLYDQLA